MKQIPQAAASQFFYPRPATVKEPKIFGNKLSHPFIGDEKHHFFEQRPIGFKIGPVAKRSADQRIRSQNIPGVIRLIAHDVALGHLGAEKLLDTLGETTHKIFFVLLLKH